MRWVSMVPLAGILGIAGALIASSYGITPNAVTVDLPGPYPSDEGLGPLTPNVDRLVVKRDAQLFWNGIEVTDEQLGLILLEPQRQEARAALLFTPDADVPYITVLEVLDLLRRHGAIDRCVHFSGIARYRKYESPDTFDELPPYTREDCPPLPDND